VDTHSFSRIITIQLAIVVAMTLVTVDTIRQLKLKQGLPWLHQSAGWFLLAVSFAYPILYGFYANQYDQHRLTVIYLAFAPFSILLSVSYEALFYACFSANLYLWLLVERKQYNHAVRHSIQPQETSRFRALTMRDVRIALCFLFYINYAFFGTGNIASISSFSLDSVFRLVTVYRPFLMAFLLIVKILVPFFMLSAVFAALNLSLNLPPFSLFLVATCTTDIGTLNFFYMVRDEGSWLEIGTSISHFCIASAFVLLTTLLYIFGEVMMRNVMFTPQPNKRRS
jgi:phosphatidylinositol glycan class N